MTPDPWCTADRHGDRRAYMMARCRCAAARAAEAAYRREWRKDRNPREIDATGTARRIQALHRLGWSGSAIGARLGVTNHQVSLLHQLNKRVYRSTAVRVAKVYDEMAMTVGPSEITRRYAAKRGWAPPLAWDDDTIDDPAARPQGVRRRVGPVDIEDVELLARCGETWEVAARRLGVTREGVWVACRRAGRADLVATFTRNSATYYALEDARNQWSA